MNCQYWAMEENALESLLATAHAAKGVQVVASPKSRPPVSISKGVATIEIKGVLTPKGLPPILKLFGVDGTSYKDISEWASLLEASDDIERVILDVDSPGGMVSGVHSAWEALRSLAAKKPVTAVNNGLMASAAYWLASTAHEILAAAPTALTGSIGVAVAMVDKTKRDEKEGVRHVVLTSKNAPLKRPDLATEEGLKSIQNRIDALERIMVEQIARGRGVPIEVVREKYGRGDVLVAKDPEGMDALHAGLIDGLGKGGESITGREVALNLEVSHMELETLSGELAAVTAERDDLKARIAAAAPFLASAEYPASIKGIALAVLNKKHDPSVLIGAVALFDAMAAESEIKAAKEDVEEEVLEESGTEITSLEDILREKE
jgi:capsid assembly protease